MFLLAWRKFSLFTEFLKIMFQTINFNIVLRSHIVLELKIYTTPLFNLAPQSQKKLFANTFILIIDVQELIEIS